MSLAFLVQNDVMKNLLILFAILVCGNEIQAQLPQMRWDDFTTPETHVMLWSMDLTLEEFQTLDTTAYDLGILRILLTNKKLFDKAKLEKISTSQITVTAGLSQFILKNYSKSDDEYDVAIYEEIEEDQLEKIQHSKGIGYDHFYSTSQELLNALVIRNCKRLKCGRELKIIIPEDYLLEYQIELLEESRVE